MLKIVKRMKFIHPFTCLVAGPTCCGKTVLVTKILFKWKETIENLKNAKILWAYGVWQDHYQSLSNSFIMHKGLPDQAYLSKNKVNLIVIDDLMNELGDDLQLVNLFTKGSHHLKISVIFIVQNIFHKSKYMRNISLNCQYLILMKNPRDRSQIVCLARQLYPSKIKKFVELFENTTKEPYSYIKVDLRVSTPEDKRLQTNIIPGEGDLKILNIDNVEGIERITSKTRNSSKIKKSRCKSWITL